MQIKSEFIFIFFKKNLFLCFFTFFMATLSLYAPVLYAAQKKERKEINITILQTSDLHHHANGCGPSIDYSPNIPNNDNVSGGFARLSTLIKNIKTKQAAAKTDVLLFDSGDFLMGTVYDMSPEDSIALKFFQVMEYDAITLGNHEFDWSPNGLYMLLSKALTSPKGFTVPIIASNMITDNSNIFDNGIENLIDRGIIVKKKLLILKNGLRVGLLGLMGIDAQKKAPAALPVSFNHDYRFIQNCVDDLRYNNKADLVIALSHGGVREDTTGDDADIACNVTGIDIIASGHFHTATQKVIVKGSSNSIIFSPGEYGKWLSRLDITFNKKLGRIVNYNFTLIPVDDTVTGDLHIQKQISKYDNKINASLAAAGVKLNTPIATTSFDLKTAPFQTGGTGSLCADSIRSIICDIKQLSFKHNIDIGVIASGVIRDPVLKGKTGIITFTDVYNCLPLGISPYQPYPPGYPLMHVYLSGTEIYTMCEAGLSLSKTAGPDYYLHFSGIKINYSKTDGVKAVYIYALDDLFCSGKTTLIKTDEKLYHVAVDFYALQMLNVVAGYGYPIVPKDAKGNTIAPGKYINFRIDADPEKDGIQEVKEWMALVKYLQKLKNIPASVYGNNGTAAKRIVFVN